MLKRVFLPHNPCNKCENFRYIIKGNRITEHCMLYFNIQISNKSANRINSLDHEYSLEPDFSKKVRNDETKCGLAGKYFVSMIED
uniref:Uncharacterized protein n=1 Tax=viral metagenome TaxID=1070528 RepID=A0A6C0HZV3_9ZZZZ